MIHGQLSLKAVKYWAGKMLGPEKCSTSSARLHNSCQFVCKHLVGYKAFKIEQWKVNWCSLKRAVQCSLKCFSFVHVCVCSTVSTVAFTIVAQGAKLIQSNGNTLESNSCSVKRGITKPKNCWRQVELLEILDDTGSYQAPGRNFPLNI